IFVRQLELAAKRVEIAREAFSRARARPFSIPRAPADEKQRRVAGPHAPETSFKPRDDAGTKSGPSDCRTEDRGGRDSIAAILSPPFRREGIGRSKAADEAASCCNERRAR